jgi:hypothetical protein
MPAEQPGMQGGIELEGTDLERAEFLLDEWHTLTSGLISQYLAETPMGDDGKPDKTRRLHKSVINRFLEPMLWHKVIVTATDWDGFFAQRVSPLAQPEIELPARLMQQAYEESKPNKIADGEWHLPYVTEEERNEFDSLFLVKLSTARCARVSYLTHDGECDPEKDVKLWDRLVTADPAHASPLEHPCRADFMNTRLMTWQMLDGTQVTKDAPFVGNLVGWMQARHLVLGF